MRILQIHNAYREHGGEDVSVAAECELLREAGHEVRQFIVRNPERPGKALSTIVRAPHNRRAARSVMDEVEAFRPDVAHVHNTWFSLSPSVFEALSESGISIVFTLRNYRTTCMQSLLFRDGEVCTDCVGRSPVAGVRHRCYRGSTALSAIAATTISLARRRGSWQRADRVLALSESQRQILVRAGLDDDRIDVVPNVVADPGPRSSPPSTSNRLLFVGRLVPEKGPKVLVDAWRELGDDRGELELVLIGDGPLRRELERNLPSGVRMTGWLEPSAVRPEMLEARALLFPTQCLEPFGRGAAEAFAAGLPVLGSDLGATAEIVGRLGPSWLVPTGDRSSWADAIAALVDGGRIDGAGRRAREAYEGQLTPAMSLSRLEATYAEATGTRSTPARASSDLRSDG